MFNYVTLQMCFRYADQITVGDELLVHGNGHIMQARVINVSSSVMQGGNHS